MFKKIIAFFLIFAMLVPFSAAAAADEPSESRSMEEILDEYHRRAFEARSQGDTRTVSVNARSGGKTLEEETVDALTSAGYEAYNVTADNYDTLEAKLNTDFADMGLDPNGSYIMVIHGEEPAVGGNSTRSVNPLPEVDQPPGDGNNTVFEYVYNGTTYQMRYVTVTAADNPILGQTSPTELFADESDEALLALLSASMEVIALIPYIGYMGITGSTLLEILPDVERTQNASLDYRGGTSWTVTQIEVYNPTSGEWGMRCSVEYATARYFIDYTYFDSTTGQYEEISCKGTYGRFYSAHYQDTAWMKQMAAIAYEYSAVAHTEDIVEEVSYKYGDRILITHQRN